MEITIDEHRAQLKKLKSFHNGSYGASINFALDIMRKYQKIEEIYYHQSGRALEDSLRAVIENEYNWRTADDIT